MMTKSNAVKIGEKIERLIDVEDLELIERGGRGF